MTYKGSRNLDKDGSLDNTRASVRDLLFKLIYSKMHQFLLRSGVMIWNGLHNMKQRLVVVVDQLSKEVKT